MPIDLKGKEEQRKKVLNKKPNMEKNQKKKKPNKQQTKCNIQGTADKMTHS